MKNPKVLQVSLAPVLLLVTGWVLLSIENAPAQTVAGTIVGTATDQSGALLPGVTVTVTNTATGVSKTVGDQRSRTLYGSVPAARNLLGQWRAVRVQEHTRWTMSRSKWSSGSG